MSTDDSIESASHRPARDRVKGDACARNDQGPEPVLYDSTLPSNSIERRARLPETAESDSVASSNLDESEQSCLQLDFQTIDQDSQGAEQVTEPKRTRLESPGENVSYYQSWVDQDALDLSTENNDDHERLGAGSTENHGTIQGPNDLEYPCEDSIAHVQCTGAESCRDDSSIADLCQSPEEVANPDAGQDALAVDINDMQDWIIRG